MLGLSVQTERRKKIKYLFLDRFYDVLLSIYLYKEKRGYPYEPSFYERLADGFVHYTLMLVKLPIFYLSTFFSKAIYLALLLSIFISGSELRAESSWNESMAADFVQLSIICVDQEFPNHWDRYEAGIQPKQRHPAFFGCYDWHSAVHGHWAMLRVWKLFPEILVAKKIEEIFDRHFTEANIAKELVYLREKKDFENPYGYGWFFRLLEELEQFPLPKAKIWRARLQPIADLFIERYRPSLELLNRPDRVGMHENTAYSMKHILHYALASNQKPLAESIKIKAKEFFGKDRDCPLAYEPGPYDFISPCLVEADLMREVLPEKDFLRWEQRFFSLTEKNEFLIPVVPKDTKNNYLVHQLGLMFQKASSMRAIAHALPKNHPRKKIFLKSAELHASKALELMFKSGYGGTHWLASFAIFYFFGAE